MAVFLRWLGVAGIELEVDGQVLLVDPFLTRPPIWRLWLGRPRPNRTLIKQNVPRCDFVLVSHAHYDHLMDVPEVVRNTGALAFGSPNTCRLLKALGVPSANAIQVGQGDQLTLAKFRVSVLPSEHMALSGGRFVAGILPSGLRPPLRLIDYRMDHSLSFLLQAAGLRILHTLSANPEHASPADVLFVSAFHDKSFYRALLRAVRPHLIVPIHWDDFFRPLTKPLKTTFRPPRLAFPPFRRLNLGAFRQMVEQMAPGMKVLFPEFMHTYDVSRYL